MIGNRNIILRGQAAHRPVAGFRDHAKMMFHIFAAARRFQRRDHGQGLAQGFGGIAGFGNHQKARGAQIQLAQHRIHGERIQIIEKMKARRAFAGQPDRTVFIHHLRQRLCAKAGAAGAEQHQIAGVLQQMRAEFFTGGQIIARFRQAQQRQGAIAILFAQPRQRGRRGGQNGFIIGGRQPVRPETAVDPLGIIHCGPFIYPVGRHWAGQPKPATDYRDQAGVWPPCSHPHG